MYCIKVKIGSNAFYVHSCEHEAFKLCVRESDAKQFASNDELLACAARAGLSKDDFEIVSLDGNAGKESSVFGDAVNNVITFERLYRACEGGSADLVLKPGDTLENGYIVVATKPDAVKIWSENNYLGDMNWNDAKQAAANFYKEWDNSDLPVVAISSEPLSKEEAESLPQSYRMTGFYYWTSTGISSGRHWRVDSDGSLYSSLDSYDFGCCPGIWVRANKPIRSESEGLITFKRLHEICEEGSADLILKPGDKLENGYIVVAVKPDSVKVWSPKNFLGDMNWVAAMKVAADFYKKWDNSDLPVEAISSELLSKEEAESISKSDRMTGFISWTSTEFSSDCHWYVYSGGSLYYVYDRASIGCFPGIWVK